LLHR